MFKSVSTFQSFDTISYAPEKSDMVWLLGVGCVEEKEEEVEKVEEDEEEVEDCLRGSSQVARPNQTKTWKLRKLKLFVY